MQNSEQSADLDLKIQEIQDESPFEQLKIIEKININKIHLDELLTKEKDKLQQKQEFSQKKDYFALQFDTTSESIFKLSLEIKRVKWIIQKKKSKANLEEKRRKFNEDFLLTLENAKKRVFGVEKLIKIAKENAKAQTNEENNESIQEKEIMLREIRRNCLEFSIRLKMFENKSIDNKAKIEELENFLFFFFKRKLESKEIEEIIDLSHQKQIILRKKTKYDALLNFLDFLNKLISNKKSLLEGIPEKERLDLSKFDKKLESDILKKLFDNYFNEMRNFQVFKNNFLRNFQINSKVDKSIVSSLEEIDMTSKKIDAIENIFKNTENEIKEIPNFQQCPLYEEFSILRDFFENLKKAKQEMNLGYSTFTKNLEKNNKFKFLEYKIKEEMEISLIFSMFPWLTKFKENLAIKILELHIKMDKISEKNLLEEDELEIIEKVWMKVKIFNCMKEFQNNELVRKLEKNQRRKENLEKDIDAYNERELLEMKSFFFEIWKGEIISMLENKEKEFEKMIKDDSEVINSRNQNLEKLKLLKKKLIDKMGKEKQETSKFTLREKELDVELKRISEEMEKICCANKEFEIKWQNSKGNSKVE